MSNPVLAEVLRGGIVESAHRGAVAVLDSSGATVLALGDIDRPIFPRSAVKGLQALPLIESGAADRYGLPTPRSRLPAPRTMASRSMWRRPRACCARPAST